MTIEELQSTLTASGYTWEMVNYPELNPLVMPHMKIQQGQLHMSPIIHGQQTPDKIAAEIQRRGWPWKEAARNETEVEA